MTSHPDHDDDPCSMGGCRRAARMAVTTLNPRDAHQVWSKVYFDDRDAPASSFRYCKTHGREMVTQLVNTLVNDD